VVVFADIPEFNKSSVSQGFGTTEFRGGKFSVLSLIVICCCWKL